MGIDNLDEISRRVIIQRFYDPDFPSQKETAQRLGITEYRERLLEESALRTLKESVEGTDAAKTIKDARRNPEAGKGANAVGPPIIITDQHCRTSSPN